MPKKNEKNSNGTKQDKNPQPTPVVEKEPVENTWWESDSVKAVATVVAVLLIPLSIIAWNAMSSHNFNIDAEKVVKLSNTDDLSMDLNDLKLENTSPKVSEGLNQNQEESKKNIIVVQKKNINIIVPEETQNDSNAKNEIDGKVVANSEDQGLMKSTESEGKGLVNIAETNPSDEVTVPTDDDSSSKPTIGLALLKLKLLQAFHSFTESIRNRERNLADYRNNSENQANTEESPVTEEESQEQAVVTEGETQDQATTENTEVSTTETTEPVETTESTEVATTEPTESVETTENVDSTTTEETQVSDNSNQNTGDRELGSVNPEDKTTTSLDNVKELPNTASDHLYLVQNGDNVYKISMKLCGNQSYYTKNMYNDYLKVGQEIKVNCN